MTYTTRTQAMYAAWEQFGSNTRVNVDFIIVRLGSTRFQIAAK